MRPRGSWAADFAGVRCGMAGRNTKRNGGVLAKSRLDLWVQARVMDRDEAVLVWFLQRTVWALVSFYGERSRVEILALVEPFLPASDPWDL